MYILGVLQKQQLRNKISSAQFLLQKSCGFFWNEENCDYFQRQIEQRVASKIEQKKGGGVCD